MNYNILGFKTIKYTRKSDNAVISGKEFYLVCLDSIQGVEGNQCMSLFLNDSKVFGTPTVGGDVQLQFELNNGQYRVSGILCN